MPDRTHFVSLSHFSLPAFTKVPKMAYFKVEKQLLHIRKEECDVSGGINVYIKVVTSFKNNNLYKIRVMRSARPRKVPRNWYHLDHSKIPEQDKRQQTFFVFELKIDKYADQRT